MFIVGFQNVRSVAVYCCVLVFLCLCSLVLLFSVLSGAVKCLCLVLLVGFCIVLLFSVVVYILFSVCC